MPAYRYVDKEEVIKSLEEAAAFLHQLDLGPATNAMINERFSPVFFAELKAVKDEAALYGAMIKLQKDPSPFVENMLVFYYHAILDTDGVGKKVYEGLHAWGAFFNRLEARGDYERTRERKKHIIALEFNKSEELKNGYDIPHPYTDMGDFPRPQTAPAVRKQQP